MADLDPRIRIVKSDPYLNFFPQIRILSRIRFKMLPSSSEYLSLGAGPIITAIIPPGGEQSEDEKLDGVVAVSGEWTLESWLASKGTVLTVPQAHAATALVPRYNIYSSLTPILLSLMLAAVRAELGYFWVASCSEIVSCYCPPRNMVSFSFSARHLTDGSVPAVQCAVCGSEERDHPLPCQ